MHVYFFDKQTHYLQFIKTVQVSAFYSKTKKSWQLWADHEPSYTMPNFYIRAVFFVMGSIILHMILKVNKLNLFHSILY